MARIPVPPLRTPFFGRLTGAIARYAPAFIPGSSGPWSNWFDTVTKQLNQLFEDLDQVGGIMGLPGAGVLGDGRHGALHISSNTTATVEFPIYQLSSLIIDPGDTWTAKADNPGGFFIQVKGRATIGGTIDVGGRGGLGGGTINGSNGRSGHPGVNFGGTGGAGGNTDNTPTLREGGFGAPLRSGHWIGGHNPGGIAHTGIATQWQAAANTAQDGQLRAQAGVYLLGATVPSAGVAANGPNGISFSAGAGYVASLPAMWTFFRTFVFGFGSGGGGGAGEDAGDTGGAGGNGGGFLVILCNELEFTGTINARGANGSAGVAVTGTAGGGGGGGGGSVIVGYRKLISNTGTINVGGGTGGAGSGAGNGGIGGTGFSKVFDMRI